ncbi:MULTISPECIES: hypothetical protein [unclassified Acinetobacter]|uniref:hypothetical protein n=1 Tax=unclassified Acinetobacter TaxID=196816 RepID=UPI0029340EEA|nr:MULTISPECIES: hypothetical protein [unclassified Acinetobacter]WOE31105.1 hypothetical protein QSG84_12255 [Acinetobacter sp. SAAs470]WOE39301.1 hypothetical protein QSG86_05920 [Acinetobacter sp. SAAs474]
MRRIVLVITLITLAIFGLLFYQYHQQQKEQQQFAIYQQVLNQKSGEIYQQATDWSKPISIDSHDPRLTAEFQTMADFTLTMMQRNAELRNAYLLRALHTIGWDQFLNVERLAKDKQQHYSETEKMLQQVQITMDLYQKNLDQQQQQIQNQINNLSIKARLRRYLTKTLAQTNPLDDHQTLFKLEKLRLQKAQQLFQLLKKHRWINQNQMIMLYDQQVVTQFNTLYQDIVQIDQQINQLSLHHQTALKKSLSH